ncbi:MAG: type II CRISPR RNA-guided endonuclease Cas9, partial [Lachnospira sp.]
MKRILGIDTGTNSLGWAVVDKNETGEYSLVRKGSLIFQEGVKIEKGIESSKASERTGYKSSRKHYFRRRLRKIEVLKALIKYGLCPPLSDEALHLWHVKKQYPLDDAFLSWQRTDEKFGRNPYYYRHVCLHEKLDLSEESERYVLGRAMYHLAQRRGFLSNRIDQTDDKESGKVKESISELSDEMQKAGCEFLGDYFYKLYNEKGVTVRIRNRYTDREEHYKKEFYEICNVQGLDAEQIHELERALYFQRP